MYVITSYGGQREARFFERINFTTPTAREVYGFRVTENGVLRGRFESKREGAKDERNCMSRSFMICSIYRVLQDDEMGGIWHE